MAYKTIEANFWQDPDVRRLSNEARLLLLFFITNPNSHFTGLFWVKLYMPLNELNWEKEELEGAMSELIGEKKDRGMIGVSEGYDTGINSLSDVETDVKPHFFIRYDEEYSLIWVKSMLRHQVGNKPLNSKQLKGLLNHIKQFKQHPMIREFLGYYREFFLQTFNHYEKVIPQLKKDLEDIFVSFSIPLSITAAAAVTETTAADEKNMPESFSGDDLNPPGKKSSTSKGSKRTGPPVNYEEELPKAMAAFGTLQPQVKNYISMVAGLNKTGKIDQSRQLSILLGLKDIVDKTANEAVFVSALDVVVEKRIDNLNYLKSVIEGKQGKQAKGGDQRDAARPSNLLIPPAGKYDRIGRTA